MLIQLPEFRIAVEDVGEGIPLLLIHGYPLGRWLWAPQVAGLSDMVRVIAPDLRGHGDSDALPGPYSMGLLADDLNALLGMLEINQPVVVCGLSMGGYVAFSFWRKYPNRVRALVLAATRAAADSDVARVGRDQAMQTASLQGVAAVASSMAPRLFAPATLQTRPDLVEKVQVLMEGTSLQGVLGDLQGMKERIDSTPDLPRIQVPTLVIYGAEDGIIPRPEVEAMAAGIPGARLAVIEGAGHLPNLEQPEVFNREVRNFLQGLAAHDR